MQFESASGRYPRPGVARGVTLIELMVVVAIAAVLLGLAVPNLRDFFITNRLASASNDLTATLSTARSEAIKRGTNVAMISTSAISGDWGGGWRMCGDANNNRVCNNAEPIIRVGAPVSAPIMIRASAGLAGTIAFSSAGRLIGPDPNTPISGVILICYTGATRARALLVSSSGRIQVAADTDSNGKPEGENGQDLNVDFNTCALS